MSEEEKEAIKIVKEITYIRGIRKDIEGEEIDEEALDTILNLIDKQEEQIEELLNDNEVLAGIVYCGRQVQIPYTTHLTDTSQFISKDKIRNKIKELEIEKHTVITIQPSKDAYNYCIKTLNELLEE